MSAYDWTDDRGWGRRFLDPLRETGDGTRFARGRVYAGQGRVTAATITPGAVRAVVGGSRPYTVTVHQTTVPHDVLVRAMRALGADPYLRETLLASEPAPGVEDILDAHGADLFPEHLHDLRTRCTCPDRGDPCKHVAAVLFTLAETFDRDPLALLNWRGADDHVLAALAVDSGDPAETDPEEPGPLSVDLDPLVESAADFWTGSAPPPVPPAVAYDPLPHWDAGPPPVVAALGRLYTALREVPAQPGEPVASGETARSADVEP
ncbi:putative Zn finger protein [Nocardiopsis sp. Huas11]|uniref:SWIM zinc finger family protein n=1 Tax=Nocardiopsis sp. Huas11 TaxID=2183912 RepID=UPI000EB2F24C|nr:SWIM zinc finger family protein [Nocardiopsis sp. Huas11]RKS08177.1 putative Zn finger protein [Nocardiopsis sp. Huas11]